VRSSRDQLGDVVAEERWYTAGGHERQLRAGNKFVNVPHLGPIVM
jgi:hypothetical protein